MRISTLTALALLATTAGALAQTAATTATPPARDTGSEHTPATNGKTGSVTTGERNTQLSPAQKQGQSTANGNGTGIGKTPQGDRPVVGGNSSTHASPLGQDLSNPTAQGNASANGNSVGTQH